MDGYLTDLQSAIDFSGVQNVNDELKAEFKESIEDIREHLVDEDVPAERITNVKSLVKEIFENSLMTKTALKEKITKQLKGTPKALKDKVYDFKDTIEKIQQPEVVDLRRSGATGKKVFRVLQGFLGIAENRGWRTNGKWTTFKIPFAQREEGFAFQLKRALWGAGQLLYNIPGGSYGDTKYVEDYYPKLTKPVELNKFKGLYYDFFNNPDTKPVDLSSFHDAGKKELQAAISAIQEQLKKPDLDTDHKKSIQEFSKKLLYEKNPGMPEDLEDSVKEELETLKTEVQKFKTTKKEEQKKIAKFMLDTIENDKDNQPPWSDVPGLDENPELQSVISDFVVLTNVVESCPPTRAQLEFFKDKGILDTSEENMAHLKEHEGIKWSASGRTLGLDSVMRDRLRRFINDQLDASLDDLSKVFSVEEFPAVKRPGGTKGARNWAGSHQDEALSPPSSQEMDFLSQSPGPSTSGLNAEEQPDSMEVTEAREVLTDEFRNVDNLSELSDESISDTEDNTESAAKRPRLEADADYTEDVALNSLNCPIKRHFSHDKRQDICSVKDKLVLDEESIELKGNKLEFEFHEPHNKNARYKVSTEIDQSRLSSLKYVGEKEKYNEHTGKSKGLRGKIGTAFGVHGLVMSVFGSINAFQRGDTVSGAITVAQTIHSLQSFESVKKLSDFAANIGKKALQKAVLAGAEKLGLSEIAERATTKLARLAESDAGLLLGDIPFVGLAFDAYFIANDIKDLTTANFSDAGEVALDVVHLALDIGTTVANMLVDTLGPEFEPVVWALSLIRMAVDDFYIDITEELKKAHGTAQKILAVFKGIAEGFVDFITGGLLRGIKQLNERKKHDQELLAKLANPKSYFKLQGTDCEGAAGTIDFTAGEFSGQGGEIKFKLNDDDSFTVQLTGVPAEGGEKQTITKKFQCKGLKDIVLGVGETQDAVWTKQKAKLWGVITVKSAEVIDKFKANDGSLYGSYTGNSKNNAFYAFQGNLSKVLKDECKDPDATGVIDLRIANYLYLLNGMAGNDSFLLGPQKAHVTGGSGHDLYYLGTHGGNTVIDNFAFDKLGDTLWINVSHVHVVCGRKDYDLLITYCGTHLVQIKEWFFPVRNEFQRHLILLTRDGIQLKVKDMGVKDDTYQVACVPVSIDRSKSLTSQRLILTDEQYREVVTVTGSKTNDYIIGNDKDNFINAGPGFNIIKGGEGSDTYILKSGDTGNIHPGLCDIIDNHANDLAQDKIFLPMNFTDIVLTAAGILPVLPEKGNKPGEESGNKIGKEIGKENGKETGKEKWKENRLIDVNKINKVLQTETDLKISHNLKDRKNGIKDKQNEIEDTQNEISGKFFNVGQKPLLGGNILTEIRVADKR